MEPDIRPEDAAENFEWITYEPKKRYKKATRAVARRMIRHARWYLKLYEHANKLTDERLFCIRAAEGILFNTEQTI